MPNDAFTDSCLLRMPLYRYPVVVHAGAVLFLVGVHAVDLVVRGTTPALAMQLPRRAVPWRMVGCAVACQHLRT